jgi:class 3 adenylate cyclase
LLAAGRKGTIDASAARESRLKMAASQHAKICKGCWEQLHVPVPLRGLISAPFRAFGIRPSRMNPNTCTICELMFTKVMRARKITIDATIMFADLRGYTSLSQSQSPDAVSGLLDAFYDECANAIWEHDGLLNKTIGDAVMAVFNFPLRREAHPRNAVLAAREIQAIWRERRAMLVEAHGLSAAELGIGIGIHTGELSFGEFGRSHRDLTAIGNVVNTASRAQSVAAADQILVTKAVFDRAQPDLKDSPAKAFQLKGFDRPIELYAA